jgi:hypothetical protein
VAAEPSGRRRDRSGREPVSFISSRAATRMRGDVTGGLRGTGRYAPGPGPGGLRGRP